MFEPLLAHVFPGQRLLVEPWIHLDAGTSSARVIERHLSISAYGRVVSIDRPSDRAASASLEPPVRSDAVAAVQRILGPIAVGEVAELGWGTYNTTLRVDLIAREPVVLRFAPRREAQLRSERDWLRSECAVTPHLVTCLGDIVPRTLGADFSHTLFDRDRLVQTLVPGVPAPAKLPEYDRAARPEFFGQLGAISRRIHGVHGDGWGPAARPDSDRWSDALERSLGESIDDLRDLDLEHRDVGRLAAVVTRNRNRIDVLSHPRLLHGDLWTANVLLDPLASTPTVTGIVDGERAWWGDPLADWAIDRASRQSSSDEESSFWSAYGRAEGPNVDWRRLLYKGRHLVAGRIEAARHGEREHAATTIAELALVLDALA